jgi:hypothetical protein
MNTEIVTSPTKSDYFSDDQHLALNQAFIELEDFGLHFTYSIIPRDPVTGFKDYIELMNLNDDESIRAILAIQRSTKVENEKTLIPILIMEEKYKQKDEGQKRATTLKHDVYRVPTIEYKNDPNIELRGFVCAKSTVYPKFEDIIDACNLAIQKYEELYYHYYWLHHIPKISEEFINQENYDFEILSKIKELDQFNILKFSLVDGNALITCDKLKIHKSFDIASIVNNPKENFTKIRDITIKYLKTETDLIFKTITFEYLMM